MFLKIIICLWEFNKCVYSSHWFNDPKNKITRDIHKSNKGFGFNCVSDHPKDHISSSSDEDLRLDKCREKDLGTENHSIPANGVAINERGGRRFSQRTKEDVRERARVSGTWNQLRLGKFS